MIETQTITRTVLLSLIMSSWASAQGSDLLTGKKLKRELARAGTIYWSASPLREAFSSITTTRRVPVWIDRRCDPKQAVTLTSQAALDDCLWEVVESNERIDVAWSQDLVYVGPPHAANRWATVNELHRNMLKSLPHRQRDIWQQRKAWKWERLTNPQDLLLELERELGHSIDGRQRVLHDLWPAAEFPPLPLFVRLELLLSGYDCTFTFDAQRKPVIRKMPPAPRMTRTVSNVQEHQAALRKLLDSNPQAKLSDDGSRLTGSWRVHEAFRRAITPRSNPPKQASWDDVQFTLRAKDQPLEQFLTQLSQQLQLKCEFSTAAKSKAAQMISFEVEKVDLQGLLTAILSPAGLKFKLQNETVHVTSQDE